MALRTVTRRRRLPRRPVNLQFSYFARPPISAAVRAGHGGAVEKADSVRRTAYGNGLDQLAVCQIDNPDLLRKPERYPKITFVSGKFHVVRTRQQTRDVADVRQRILVDDADCARDPVRHHDMLAVCERTEVVCAVARLDCF